MLTLPQTFPVGFDRVPPYLHDLSRRRDNVHDFVFLNEIEERLVDTREFQRLRYIKQLGFAHLIYETAEHSRFVHSLGVCHTAKALADYVNRNCLVSHLKLQRTSSPKSPTLFETGENGNGEPITPPIHWAHRVCIGLAGLLHDIPHPPMSHALEHECPVLVKHDAVDENPQLYLYLFGPESEIAAVLRFYSERFREFLTATSEHSGVDVGDLDRFLAANGFAGRDLLAALVFEILAFKSPEEHPHRKFEYIVDWGKTRREFRLSDFFFPYCSELVTNTICADLIDYLLRDAENTGVQRSTELKFLDRITIKKGAGSSGSLPRVVFDLVDQRRFELRKDAVSDLLALLESRYSLMERVYMHRSKLAASAMLGRAYALAREAKIPGLEIAQLYSTDGPCSDDALLRKLLASDCTPASELTRRILSRKLYRPLFIIDEEVCRSAAVPLDKQRLIKQFRPKPTDWRPVLELERELARSLVDDEETLATAHPVIVFCMNETVAYKDPRVLVEVPRRGEERKRHSEFRSIPDAEGILGFLRDVTSDRGVQQQIGAMLANFNTLWKLYVFADPAIVEKYKHNIPRLYAKFVEVTGVEYPVSGYWEEAGKTVEVGRDELKREVWAHSRPEWSKGKEPGSLLEFLKHPRILAMSTTSARRRLQRLSVRAAEYGSIFSTLWPEFVRTYPAWDSPASQSDRAALEKWVFDQIALRKKSPDK